MKEGVILVVRGLSGRYWNDFVKVMWGILSIYKGGICGGFGGIKDYLNPGILFLTAYVIQS